MPKCSDAPLQALTVFTDGSGKTGKSVIVQEDPHTHIWQSDIIQSLGLPQIVELAAVVGVFQCWDTQINIVTDSVYVANLVQRMENCV